MTFDPSDTTAGDAATANPAERLAARLPVLDLDAETLEIIMAALTVDVCDWPGDSRHV